jgi:DNA polymerase-1
VWIVCDIETNGLEDCDTIWCIICKDIDTGERYEFVGPDYTRFIDFASRVDCWIGHYFLGFDYLQLNRLLNVDIKPEQIIDTLVVARLANFAKWDKDGRPSPIKHSLDAWGERFGLPKLHPNVSFENFSEEILERCSQDVSITELIYNHYKDFIHDPANAEALQIEHQTQVICNDIHSNGFSFDYESAKSIHADLLLRLDSLGRDLQDAFPPKSKLIREITPKRTKHGSLSRTDFRWLQDSDLTPYSPDASFSRFEYVPFKPSSSKHRIEVLNASGWTPYDKTKGHIAAEEEFKAHPTEENRKRLDHFKVYGWKTSEDNLETLPASAPEASRKLVEWLLLNGRRSTLEEWFAAWRPLPGHSRGGGRIHGTYSGIGAWTMRKAHSNPNMANTPSRESKYNGPELKELAKEFGIKLRSCFTVPQNKLLIGTDADGIQLRILAHYMQDESFTEALVNGSSENGTDAHTLNWKALGSVCSSRATAKTFIYAWLLGAGVGKVANIFGCSHSEAKQAMKNFLDNYPGLRYLKESVIPSDAQKGYFIGFDGRIILCPSEYFMLAGYLQCGESVIMKHAAVLWREQLQKEGIWFKQVNDVHDEWQTEVEDDLETANYIGSIQANSIKLIGEKFNLNCPFKGNYKIGHNWNDTH